MSDDDKKKKIFNPYLAPLEEEDEPKLDDEEDVKPAVPEEEPEEEEEFDDGGEIVVQQPGSEEEEEAYEELVDDESEIVISPQAKPEPVKAVVPKVLRPRTWSFYALGLLLVLVLCDVLAQRLGILWFWTPRTIYVMSYVLRCIVFLIAAYAWHRSLFRDDASAFQVVFLWLGLSAGILLAVLRFISAPSFWAFINMAIEPIDTLILALASWFFVIRLSTKLKIIKQTV